MSRSSLDPDCASCLGICCIAPSFAARDNYAIDKAEGVRCFNLGDDRRCRIHDHLAAEGMGGCIEYTCYGAGQRLCREIMPGIDWLSCPERTDELFDTYFKLKGLHEIMWFLSQMAALCPDPDLKLKIEGRLDEIDALGANSIAEIRNLDVDALAQRDRIWGELVEKAQAREQAHEDMD